MATRQDIKTGDMLIWSKDSRSLLSNLFLKLIRLATMSEYAHVGTALWLEGRLYVVEATIPMVRLAPIRDDEEFYFISMDVNWNRQAEDFLLDKVGLFYSILDSIRAQFGITTARDDKWQCVEISNYLYKELGIDLGDVFTPSKIVEAALDLPGKRMVKVRPLIRLPLTA